MNETPMRIVYCTPALYMAGGVERVLTLKANYFAEHFGYNITIILTEGKDKPLFYPLSSKVNIINLDIGFEELWNCDFTKKIFVYLRKQRLYKKKLRNELMQLRPDITVSLLRREINFITSIKDGSKKIGEMHVNRANYRNFEANETNFVKSLFGKWWMFRLIGKLHQLNKLVVLTEKDKEAWSELNNVISISNPLSFTPKYCNQSKEKRVIAVGRYCHEKGYDHLLQAWAKIQEDFPEWRLEIFGDGDRTTYEQLIDDYHIIPKRCILHGRTPDIELEYAKSSIAVCSSRFEGFGLSIIEAMAYGTPVISYDCPWGPSSIIKDGEDGLLVSNGNIIELSKKLSFLLSNANEVKRLGNNARQNVQRFSMDVIAKQWKALFESVTNDK